jgi:hypothetical protein
MGKHANKAVGDEKTKIVFATVTKEVGEGDAKQIFTLKYDEVTERFSLKKDDYLIVSSCNLNDCVLTALSYKISFSPEEKKISYKPIKPIK